MNSRAREMVDDACETLKAQGFTPTVDVRYRHIRVWWTDLQGHRRFLVIAQTPGDFRARANSRAALRRMLRDGNGVGRCAM